MHKYACNDLGADCDFSIIFYSTTHPASQSSPGARSGRAPKTRRSHKEREAVNPDTDVRTIR